MNAGDAVVGGFGGLPAPRRAHPAEVMGAQAMGVEVMALAPIAKQRGGRSLFVRVRLMP
ncbi:MAG: hypothetical protein KIT72_09950 [Polyangiaceae bacterium]|nr:hypothetical protein [Polyangiaceae bacterium]MCW5790732.1 hypothetical protein [Polyangiaceae bacterium]